MASPAPGSSQNPNANPNQAPNPNPNANASAIFAALANTFRSPSGEMYTGPQIANLLQQNMSQLGELAKQGRLTHAQIMQLKDFADKHKSAVQAAATPPPKPAPPSSAPIPAPASTPAQSSTPAPAAGASQTLFSPQPDDKELLLSANPRFESWYPIAPASSASETNTGPVAWPIAQAGRPTLTGGMAGGRIAGTPAQIARLPDDPSSLTADDSRTRRKNTPGDQSMRRSVQDLVSSIDPNIKIEAEVEDLLLEIADEFIDSVTNFGCRLAKHRGGDALEVRDLQLHLERNHNIRIPGFASDETRVSLSQTGAPAPAAIGTKKTSAGNQMTLRSHRLAQVQQAKREGKLL